MDYETIVEKMVNDYVDINKSTIIGDVTEKEIKDIKAIGVDIIKARDGKIKPGKFVNSILANNLYGVISFGDTTCLKAIKIFLLIKLNCHVQ